MKLLAGLLIVAVSGGLSMIAVGREAVLAELETDLVPSPVPYAVLLPPGYDEGGGFPLILNLHGGGGSRDNLIRQQPLWERAWTDGELPPFVMVMPSVTARGFYMNFKDGTERWEDFIVGPFLEHLRATYKVSRDPQRTFLTGASMGGMGSLRIAFRYPDRFGAVAALEPGIEPILRFEDMRPKHRFWRSDELLERAYGSPLDPEYWAASNPASMVVADAKRIRDSGLEIYLEAGDEDQFWLYEGAEFLHRVLWDQKIKHEYHLVRGADHVGASMSERFLEAAQFLIRSYNPWPELEEPMRSRIQVIERLKDRVDEADHYSQ